MSTPKYPDACVDLTGVGADSNIFFIIARASQALRIIGVEQSLVKEFAAEVVSTKSYDQAIQTVMRWMNVR